MIIVRYLTKMGSHLGDIKVSTINQAIDRAINPYGAPIFARDANRIQVFQEDGEGHDLTFELSPKGRAWLMTWACEYSQKELGLVDAKFPRVMIHLSS